MNIVIVFDGKHFFIDPNPAVVQSGEPVEWLLWYAGSKRTGEIRWRLHFDISPFLTTIPVGTPLGTYEIVVLPDNTPMPVPQAGSPGGYPEGVINPGNTGGAGLYKYDIAILDQYGNTISEDDPYLLVQSQQVRVIP